MKHYSKLIGTLVVGLGGWITVSLADGEFTTDDWKALLVLVAGAVGTFFAPKNAENA